MWGGHELDVGRVRVFPNVSQLYGFIKVRLIPHVFSEGPQPIELGGVLYGGDRRGLTRSVPGRMSDLDPLWCITLETPSPVWD